MIKNITLKWVRGISKSFELKEWLNNFVWKNWTWKSTVIQSITDAFRWEKIQVKEWEMTLNYDDNMIQRNANRLFSSPKSDIDLVLPGFLMWKHKTIKGVNSTNEERRITVSNLLGIDRTKFFLDAWIDYDLKWAMAELRDMNTKSSTYADELITLESKKSKKLTKPTVVKLIQWSEEKVEKWNAYELESLNNSLSNLRLKWKKVPEEPTSIDKIDFIPDSVITEWNQSEIDSMKKQLAEIAAKWQNMPDICEACGQTIQDVESAKAKLRLEYTQLSTNINNTKVIDREVQPSNLEAYNKNANDIADYNLEVLTRNNIIESNTSIEAEAKEIQSKIDNFKLVKDTVIPAVIWNDSEYQDYLDADRAYALAQQESKWIKDRIKETKAKIKSLSTEKLEDKIEAYKDTELAFVESVDKQLTVGDVKFVFYKANTSPNATEPYAAVFDILYNWKSYTELSGWEQVIVDVVIATLFIKKLTLDFILIDNAEISDSNIKMLMKEYLDWVQVICTRIWTSPLTLKHTI